MGKCEYSIYKIVFYPDKSLFSIIIPVHTGIQLINNYIEFTDINSGILKERLLAITDFYKIKKIKSYKLSIC